MNVFLSIIEFTGALALFIYGMKEMSGGIQKAAGRSLRGITQQITKNKYVAFTTGFIMTGLIQSSSAVTVMTVSFVNAGLLSLMESAGLILGANVGTTLTAWLISILEFKIQLHQLSLPLIAVAVPLMILRRDKLKYWGEFILGFALLFYGLFLMRELMPNFNEHPESLQFLKDYADSGLWSAFLFLIVGIIITFFIQSSTAAMALTMVMCSKGWLSYDIATAMILGENIGTTVTAEIAAIVGNVHAKRSARIHTLFNLFGVIIFLPLLPFFLPVLDWILATTAQLKSPAEDPSNIPIALSAFHTSFNVINALIFIPFLSWLVKMAEMTVKSKTKKDSQFHLDYIPSSLKTSELSLPEARKELQTFTELTRRMGQFNHDLLFQTDPDEQVSLYKKVKKYEKISNRINLELVQYLTKLAQDETTPETSIEIRKYLSVCSDLERIGDLFFSMSKALKMKIRQRIWFNQHQRERIKDMYSLIDEAFSIVSQNLEGSSQKDILLEQNKAIYIELNHKKDSIRKEDLSALFPEEFNIQSAYIYTSLGGVLEEVGEHIKNINELLLRS